jgi:hypothetical protein
MNNYELALEIAESLLNHGYLIAQTELDDSEQIFREIVNLIEFELDNHLINTVEE